MKALKEILMLVKVFFKHVWVLVKRIYAYKNIPDVKYHDLGPIENVEDCEEHIRALKWAFANQRIKNVALTGPYGAGKSSIISTFLERNPVIEEQSIRLSLATFSDMTEEDSKLISINIEEGIFKQLFYKVKQSEIPQSRFRKIERIQFWKIFGLCLFSIAVVLCLTFIFAFETFSKLFQTIYNSGVHLKHICVDLHPKLGSIIVSDQAAGGISLLFIAIIVLLATFFIAKRIQKHDIRLTFKGDKLPIDATVGQPELNSDSIFDKHIDELLYFFESTKYRYVFIEDLDRFNDPGIFVKLRELNALLNNYDAIKERVVFVYAIGDNMFRDTERTKFFDFIIPVIPVINSTNSGEILQRMLQPDGKKEVQHDISRGYILDVSPFISDMRILQNIYNEFLIYKTTLVTQQKLELKDEPMMSLIIFKNLYPTQFANLQMEKGLIKEAFEAKKSFLNNKTKELQAEIKKKTDLLLGIEEDTLKSANELRYAFLGELTGWQGIVSSFGTRYGADIAATALFQNNFDTDKLIDSNVCRLYYRTSSGGHTTMSLPNNYAELVSKYCKRLEYLQYAEGNKREAVREEIEELQQKIRTLSACTLKKLCADYGVDEVISSEKVKANRFLVFMLRKGYIHEGYADYMNFFKGNSISTEDMNYILAVKNQQPLDFQYPLTKKAQLMERLQPYEFEELAILNVDLLEFMLSYSEYDNELHIMINQLANGSNESWKFIDLFMDLTTCEARFVQMLSTAWPGMWHKICSHEILTYDRKIRYLASLLSNCSVECLSEQNMNGSMTEFFECHEDILQRLAPELVTKLTQVIPELGITFKKISIDHVQADLLDFIFDGCHYSINIDMIQAIVTHRNKELCGELETKNYTTILALGYDALTAYIHGNLDSYIEDVFLSEKNTKEEVPAIAQLTMRVIENSTLCEKIITHEDFCAISIWDMYHGKQERISDSVQFVWDTVLKQGKVQVSWENVYAYWGELNLSDALLQYIDENAESLCSMVSDVLTDAFKRDVITSELSIKGFGFVRSRLRMNEFDIALKDIAEEKLTLMIQNCDFEFTSADYKELSEYMPDQCVPYILRNQSQFEQVMDEIDLTSNSFEELVLSPEFGQTLKEKVINQNSQDLMTEKAARAIYAIGVTLSIESFWAVWNKLNDVNEQVKFFYSHYKCLGVDDVEKCFLGMGEPFDKFTRQISWHKEYLLDTPENRELAAWLKSIKYLTSTECTTQQKLDGFKNIDVPLIACRIKAK